MLNQNLSIFCQRNEKYKHKFRNCKFPSHENAISHNELESDKILEMLCEFLMQPECTQDVAECFPELLPALVSLAISPNNIQLSALTHKDVIHKLNCVILGKLVDINQGLRVFVLRYFDVNPAPFESFDTDTVTSPKKRKINDLSYNVSEISDYDIVIACHNILRSAVSHFKHKWNWSKFYKYLINTDDKVKWVALKCIAIVLNMSESTRLSYAQTFITNFEQYLTDHEDASKDISVMCASFESMECIVKDVSSVVSIDGILLPTLSRNRKTHSLISVPSMRTNLQNLAIAIGSRKCICLQGPVGCGKTALVEYLAGLTGHDATNFVKVQLGDQTDSKMLLGMYRCTDVPGEFVWQPGVLTQAVLAGKWLLLEDIDSAALDVASVLGDLMETGKLCVPGYRDTIYANSGFQLFVTQRLGAQKHAIGSSSLLQKYWLCLKVEPLSRDELVIVVQTLFPVLSTVATRIVDVFLLFSVGNHDSKDLAECIDDTLPLKTKRQTSTRDLIKWCSRAIVDFDVSSSDSALKMFQDAIDVFCCSVPNQEQRLNLATAVAHKLGIINTKAEYFCNMHKPSIVLFPEILVAGRAKLLRKMAQYARIETDRTNFSFTRPSACLLERITSCVMQKEPVLLVGETGTGKTSSIQYLARSTGHKLTIINMNQQSESADLLGGYKPVNLKYLISPIREEFEILFRTYFEIEPNRKYLEQIGLYHKQQKWKTLVTLMSQSTRAAIKRLRDKCKDCGKDSAFRKDASGHSGLSRNARKNRRSRRNNLELDVDMLRKWENMLEKLNKLSTQVKSQYALAFSFIEGSLVRALRDGYWILLDEINLANAETLECLSGLLENSTGSLPLLERGDGEPVKRHPDFTMFACMNPATDIGKRDLPVGLRNRFTEFYIDELTERSDLQLLVSSYLKELNLPMEKHEAIVKFYLSVRQEAMSMLFDGTAHKPHYSLRTLCRALYISASNPCGNILRSLYEAFSLSFLTQLDYNSYPIVQKMIAKAILDNKNLKAILGTPIPKPKCSPGEQHIYIEGYWVLQGSLTPETPNNYILTDSVRRNLKDLVRVVSIGKIPILLQGDTSVGKTSLITYLAKVSGHVCVRINNHEHTDLQEYVGSYIADETGKLIFKEGVLVDAMRKGYWVILDELNLAPSDVLEALNRVLDDNRELFIPETQQVVKAHEHFMLFATQNPPGLYGGRKVLSRAFRNRFVELHFGEIPANELQIILNKRCSMPESYCKQVINVMTDLQIRRKSTAAFAGKKGFITLRDLFRWGERYRLAPDVGNRLYDWSQHLADEGYLVLAAKVRRAEEADEIRQVIKKHLRRDVEPDSLFTLNEKTSPVTRHILEEILNNGASGFGHIVWTYHMRRMAVLVKKSCQFKEPVLLIGETGGGKTTVCQLIAAINGQTMRAVNCHMHTESSDFLGNLRPVREHDGDDQRLFEWVDGPLINAMRNGDLFLADEISLADDSVLERLNSLLEPERSLLLAEKGIDSSHGEDNTVIVADEKFVFVGTMNPGGDYGKKELSPALRNRFTEVWCEGCVVKSDLRDIIVHNLRIESQTTRESVADAILRFTEWLPTTEVGKKLTVSIRDILTWVDFMNTCTHGTLLSTLTIGNAYYHGACLTYIDSLGSGSTGSESTSKLKDFADTAIQFIKSEIEKNTIESNLDMDLYSTANKDVWNDPNVFGIPPFYIEKGPHSCHEDRAFTFTTPTTKLNTLKLLRALQLSKPILLEGSPGVGKTSLVSALAKATRHTLLRINLSDQTDVSDLFGADLPVEGGKGGEFAWRDGPFLRALRAGYWILLDELNLASQSVLEGLNACFDHRGEIYVPELGKTFSVKPGTRLFGCQNPLRQGGARRGLPKSFLNRFTQVSIDTLMEDDLKFILIAQFLQLPADLINDMVRFNGKLASEAGVVWGHAGSPWEMNLRDITRWCELTIEAAHNELRGGKGDFNPGDSVELIYVNRMRTKEDRQKIRRIYQEIFSPEKYPLPPNQSPMHITRDKLYIGDVTLSRKNCNVAHEDGNLLLLRDQKPVLKSLMQCVKMNWMSILIGASACGKSTVVRLLAALTGQKLRSIAVNTAMDTTEILGGFEQTDYNRHLEQLYERVASLLIDSLQTKITVDRLEQIIELHGRLEQVRRLFDENVAGRTMAAETELFLRKIKKLSRLVSAMKIWEPSYESQLRDIESRLKSLSTSVKRDKCLNAGGKFEWVDSVLVKCLLDGTWLLIDQVNLCSPAVLDRLNGLLEPNGVLSIGERGVDSEGNVVTVKPHENFRLFLTMDPRYGEISRAMRNRGVEIYMLGSKENVDHNVIDLTSLLSNAGIARPSHRDALFEIYNWMSKEIVDPLNVVDLLHTAFLTKQRSLRGFPAKQSISNVCIDVYIKDRLSIREPHYFTSLEKSIDEIIERYIVHEKEIVPIDLDAVTWNVQNLQDNSLLTVIRQQGLPLNAFMKLYKSHLESEDNEKDVVTVSLNDLCDFLHFGKTEDCDIWNADVADVLSYFLLNFYELSTRDDARLRMEWISKLLRENRISNELEKKNALMAEEIASFRFRSASGSSLPWDLRQLVGKTIDKDDSACSDANKLRLLLYACSMIFKSDTRLTEVEELKPLKNKNAMSVREYSYVVHHGKLSSQLKNQPLITYFVKFLQQTNSCINAILHDDNINISFENYVELRKELKRYARFERLGEMTLVNKSKMSKSIFTNVDRISSLLWLHYKWLLKFLRKLYTMVRKYALHAKTISEMQSLSETIDDLNDQLDSVYDPITKISKRIKKQLTLPPPHSSEFSMNVHSKLRKITRILDLAKDEEDTRQQKMELIFILLNEIQDRRREMINVWKEVYYERSIETLLSQRLEPLNLPDIEQFCENQISAEIENFVEETRKQTKQSLNARIQLRPIYEYMFLSFACNLQGKLCLEWTTFDNFSTLEKCLENYFYANQSLPTDLMGLLCAISRHIFASINQRSLTDLQQKQKALLLPELFRHLARFLRRSNAVRDPTFLLHSHGLSEDIEEEDAEKLPTSNIESKTKCYFGGPVLLNLILRLIWSKINREKEKYHFSTTLEMCNDVDIFQLRLLNEILWYNSISLTNERYNFANSDLMTLKYYLHLYTSAIDRMNAEYDVRDVIATAIEKSGNRAAEIECKLRTDYFEPVEELCRIRDEINTVENVDEDNFESALRRGRAWMSLGYIQLLLFGSLDQIDPIRKMQLKFEYLTEDIVDYGKTIYVTTLQNHILGISAENEHAHPILAAIKDCEERLLKTWHDFDYQKAFRPSSVNFSSLSKDSADFRKEVGSYKLVQKHMNNLSAIASKINEDFESADLTVAESALQEAEIWSLSIQRFAEQIETKYQLAYPDVILPLLTALAQLRHGVYIIINEVRRLISLRKSGMADLNSVIYNLLRFPTIGPQQESLLSLSNLCVSKSTQTLISKSFRSADTFVRMQKQFLMFKSGLQELHNQVTLNGSLTKSLWQNINALLQQIVLVWKQQQKEEEKRAVEKESLYKNKIKRHTLTEEEELALEVRELFPMYCETDFHDIEEGLEFDINWKDAPSKESNESFNGVITENDIREIQRIHSDIVISFVTSKLYNDSTSVTSVNYIGPLLQRYDVVYNMFDDILPSLSGRLTSKLYNSLSVLIALGVDYLNEEESFEQTLRENVDKRQTKAYDFYKDSNDEEIKRCFKILQSIEFSLPTLMSFEPDHPVLKSIQCILDRIYKFPITSAVSRFLTGLELLLVKMRQWKETARIGVKDLMSSAMESTQQIIIEWRKLELSCWKSCLDTTFDNLKSKTCKWWFFLYALVESYSTRSIKDNIEKTENDEPITRQKLMDSLERFMNESSLVEFESRLNLLLTFYCHVHYFNDNDDKNELLAILWNVYNYYKQFLVDVNAKIATLRAPIEKKLKDFVKIARWDDVSYWAMKETVKKTHHTLLKFTKEFQNALKQNVSCCLTVKSEPYNTETARVWDDQDHRKYSIIPTDFTVTESSRSVKVNVLFTSGLIMRAETLLAKAKHLCKEIVLVSSYPCIRTEIENFVEDFLEQSARLRGMEVDRNLPKNKQQSQAKSILQQKKMTLANYFKVLTRLGVSYRTGVLMLKNNADKIMDFTVSPVDLSVINRYFKLKNIDQHMLIQWKGCEKYYYKSLIRLNALNAMLSTNQTDLGLHNMERCRGYSAHIMLMAHKQKMTIARSFDHFLSLRTQISDLSEIREEDSNVSKQHDGRNCAESLKTLLITLKVGFEQLLLFLQCCPMERPILRWEEYVLTLDVNALPITAVFQQQEVWQITNALVHDILISIKVIAKHFHALFMPFETLSADHSERSTYTSFLSSKHFEFLKQCCVTIEDLRIRNTKLKQLFGNSNVAHPILETIMFLDTKMKCFLDDFENLWTSVQIKNKDHNEKRLEENNTIVERYELSLEHLINTILLVIQKKYKDHSASNDAIASVNENSKQENYENDNDTEEEIEENKLKKRLIEALEKDISDLKLSKITELFFSLLQTIHELDLHSANYCTRLLLKCLPLLEQYILLVQFYLNEQVASFRITCKMLYLQLNVFLDLAANGFCVPKDLDLENDETDESGQKTDKGGMGLADGEGTKDVSDRIETEDQLEEARPADQEKEKQEDKTCKEEEKGIDMSEDFGSKLQDMEKDDEERSDDDEENDLDREMGETGEGAEQLDKKIWDDDKEESQEDNHQQENEDEEGTGEQIGEKQMSAKDDKDKRRQNDDDDTGHEENRQEEEKKEINELNEPEIDDDQIDPYHGKQQLQPEPEAFDLPEDLNLDEDGKEENGGEEENPFDIDKMKDSKPLSEKENMELEKEAEENEENDPGEDTSENEDDNDENVDKDDQREENTQEDLETNKETEEKSGGGTEAENKDEEQNREEEMEEEKLQEKAAPSADDASTQVDAAQQVEETKEGSRDAVAQKAESEDRQEASAENTQQKNNDKGTGQSQSSQQESGHSGSSEQDTVSALQSNAMTKPAEKRKNPGESNEDHSLLDKFEPTLKKLKTVYTQDEVSKNEEDANSGDKANGDKAEMYQHIKDSERFDDCTLDAATENQVKQQASNTEKEEENRQENDTMNVEMHQDEENVENNKITEQNPEKVSHIADDKCKKDSDGKGDTAENGKMETTIEMEGEAVETAKVLRGNESTFHTAMTSLEQYNLDPKHMERKRFTVEKMLSEWTQIPSTNEATTTWKCLCSITDTAARDLSEKLRLVLEPTQASRLKGDYKTGKRINMRKIIPYIASQFRKDKIWLRRTKPSKRDYQIVLALDDSSSMADNHSKELAFESLSLISKAMTYLEVGELGIVSFGEQVKVLHPLGEAFTERSGSRLIQEMRFDQKKTMIGELVDFTVDMFESQPTSSDNAKLLVVLSDGRGIFSEGTEKVNRAVRRARLEDIFLVFIIVDNPINKDSILDIRMPIFEKSKLLGIRSYMDNFPFPFYMILRDVNTLPEVLSDALRQWFEVVGKIDT